MPANATRTGQAQFEKRLREAIAGALHGLKSYQLPAECVRLGLAVGTEEEAFSSKRSYVKARIETLGESDLLDLARRVLADFEDPTLRDMLSERDLPDANRITEITRRQVLKAFDGLDELFGEQGSGVLWERLDLLAPSWNVPSASGILLRSLSDDIEQHYLRNADWSHAQMLERCGALRCAQHRFFGFIEHILRPEAHTGDVQAHLAATIDEALKPDGYGVIPSAYVSGHPAYSVVKRHQGVAGQAKNLIFASIGAKPEMVLIDAVNNDVQITKNADLVLTYERPISSADGLTWRAMAEWWQQRESLADLASARRSLGDRLLRSLPNNSPGEYALFRTYFDEFGARLGDQLPALIPQVYLHYDPLTAKQRGGEAVLPRQRMDFLLLLPQGVRVVLEVDGQHHYAHDGRASPKLYAEMIVEDRRLRLRGYDLYRFGSAEFEDTTLDGPTRSMGSGSRAVAKTFFEQLFARYRVGSN